MTRPFECDVLVVGCGPAGLAVCIGARLAGLRVSGLDRRRPPIDKACGEGLMPDGLTRLDELGVEIPDLKSATFRGIRYIDGEVRAEGFFRGRAGAGIRRTALHDSLRERAEQLGVDLHWGLTARGLERGQVVTDHGRFRARWIVAADGLNSRMRDWAGLRCASGRHARFGVRRHYLVRPWSRFVEVYWADGAEAYVTPVGPDRVGVALLWGKGKSTFDRLLPRFPELARRLRNLPVISTDRGAGPLYRKVPQVIRGNLALVGDASGYLDALTGEGLTLALHQAAALVTALGRANLRTYARAHRRLRRVPDATTRLVLFFERRPWLRRKVIRALAADPQLFSRAVTIHAGALPLRGLGLHGVLRLAGRVLVS